MGRGSAAEDHWSAAGGHDIYQKLKEKKRSSSWCAYYRYVKIIRLMYCPGICNIFMMIVRRTRVCHKLGWDTPKLYFQLLNDSEALIFGVPFFWTNPRVRSVHTTPSIPQMLGGSTISLGPKCYWWYWWGYAHPGSRMWQHQLMSQQHCTTRCTSCEHPHLHRSGADLPTGRTNSKHLNQGLNQIHVFRCF